MDITHIWVLIATGLLVAISWTLCKLSKKQKRYKRSGLSQARRVRLRTKLYKDQKGKCKHCKRKKDLEDMQLDHIKPLARGGSNEDTNFQILCGRCNRKKSDRLETEM